MVPRTVVRGFAIATVLVVTTFAGVTNSAVLSASPTESTAPTVRSPEATIAPQESTAESPETRAFHDEVQSALLDPKTELGSSFAGAWVDPGDRDRVFVAFKGEAAAERAKANRANSRLAANSRVSFISHKFSQAEQMAALDRSTEALSDLLLEKPDQPLWPFHLSLSNRNGYVAVLVDDTERDRENEIKDVLAKDLESGIVTLSFGVLEHPRKMATNPCPANRFSVCQPTRGGQAIYGPNGSCSSGFVMRDNIGIRLIATSGHCGLNGDGFFLDDGTLVGTPLGNVVWRQNSGKVDGAVIKIYNPDIAQPNNSVNQPCTVGGCTPSAKSDVRVPLTVNDPREALEGRTLCVDRTRRTGSWGEECGTLVGWAESYDTYTYQGHVDDLLACDGDSGSPITEPGSSFRAFGILQGADCSPIPGQDDGWFTWLQYLEDAAPYGITQLLSDSTERLWGGPLGSGQGSSLRAEFGDQRLVSPNGSYKAVMQQDGNFVLYGPGGAIWSSNTSQYGDEELRVVMQHDGKMIVYDNFTSVCSTPSAGGSAYVRLQNDGNLVLYRSSGSAVWVRGPGRTWSGCTPSGV